MTLNFDWLKPKSQIQEARAKQETQYQRSQSERREAQKSSTVNPVKVGDRDPVSGQVVISRPNGGQSNATVQGNASTVTGTVTPAIGTGKNLIVPVTPYKKPGVPVDPVKRKKVNCHLLFAADTNWMGGFFYRRFLFTYLFSYLQIEPSGKKALIIRSTNRQDGLTDPGVALGVEGLTCTYADGASYSDLLGIDLDEYDQVWDVFLRDPNAAPPNNVPPPAWEEKLEAYYNDAKEEGRLLAIISEWRVQGYTITGGPQPAANGAYAGLRNDWLRDWINNQTGDTISLIDGSFASTAPLNTDFGPETYQPGACAVAVGVTRGKSMVDCPAHSGTAGGVPYSVAAGGFITVYKAD